MKIVLIANPASASVAEELRRGVEGLREVGHEVEARLTFEGGDGWRFATEAAVAGAELVIAAGGDGMVNEVANGLHGYLESAAVERGPRLGVVPLGTANDLAVTLGVPESVEAALRVAVEGVPLPSNVGLVNERCFLNVSTGGFGAEATAGAPRAAKRALGTVAYLLEGIRRFAVLEPCRARFVADAEEELFSGDFLLFAVGNARSTGGGTELTPRAELQDGLLDVCIVEAMSRVEFMQLLPDLRAGEHLDHPAVIYRQIRRLEVESAAELQINADGEPLRARRFRYRLSPHLLTLMSAPPDRV